MKTNFHGSGLGQFGTLTNLTMLGMHGCSLQDGRGLSELKQVKRLWMWDAYLAPAVLSHIHKMENLRDVDLSGSSINNEQLVELSNATQLTGLNLGWTNASEAALNDLRAKLPNTRIVGEPANSGNAQPLAYSCLSASIGSILEARMAG